MKKAELLACVDREIKMRERVYPRWVEGKRMSQDQANKEIFTMREVRLALEKYVPDDVQAQGSLFTRRP